MLDMTEQLNNMKLATALALPLHLSIDQRVVDLMNVVVVDGGIHVHSGAGSIP